MAKTSVIIEYFGSSYNMDDIITRVKEDWTARGNKVKDLNANVYVKIEEFMVYYVVNEETYSFSLKS